MTLNRRHASFCTPANISIGSVEILHYRRDTPLPTNGFAAHESRNHRWKALLPTKGFTTHGSLHRRRTVSLPTKLRHQYRREGSVPTKSFITPTTGRVQAKAGIITVYLHYDQDYGIGRGMLPRCYDDVIYPPFHQGI